MLQKSEVFNVTKTEFSNVAETNDLYVAKNEVFNVTQTNFFNITKSTTYLDVTKIKFYNVPETDRSSHRRCSVKKGVLRNFGEKKVLKFLRALVLQNTSGYLLLD